MTSKKLEESERAKKDTKILYQVPMTLLMLDARLHSYGRLLLRDHGGTPLCNIGHSPRELSTQISTFPPCAC